MTPYFRYPVILISVTLILLLISKPSNAEENKIPISWGFFIDSQYAYDLNSPASGDRAFTTQAARNNEFNINLAHVEAKIDENKLRARFALQVGTSVQRNYSSEPTNGSVSGGDLSRHIQEARIGFKISEKTWIDAGIFFAHVGAETWISKDNITLTRSFVADYSPYYLSGLKINHKFSDRLTAQVLVTNGWQNISENNKDKNIGTSIEYSSKYFSLAYNTLIGREISGDLNSVPRSSQFRHFHDFIIKSINTKSVEWIAQFDIGFQNKPIDSPPSKWYGTSLMLRYKLNENQKVSFRFEQFRDDDQIVLVTEVPNSLNIIGGSIGFDHQFDKNLFWRNEVRYLKATENVFPKELNEIADSNLTFITSLAFNF